MTLRAGFASIDISPPKENALLGYEFRQQHLPPGNEGVHDPLLARVLVLHDGAQPAAIISLDLCILLVPLARRLRKAVADKLGIAPERVLLSCTHTHSGPFPMLEGQDKGFLSTFVREDQQNPDVAYAQELEQRLLDATARAGNLLFPVCVESQQAPCAIAYTRRHRLPEDRGIALIWNPQETKTLETAPNAPTLVLNPENTLLPTADPTCTLLVLRQTNGPRTFCLWSLGAHPTVMGKTSRVVSADWPGLACHQLDAASPNTHAIFLLGPCGDTHAWVATQESYENLRPVATAASSFVSLLAQATHASPGDALRIASKTIQIGQADMDLAAWRIGSVTIVAAPVELFAQLGADLRTALGKTSHVIFATNTQGWTGYWPTRAAFEEGDYEVNAAKAMGRSPGDGEKLIDELVSLAKSL